MVYFKKILLFSKTENGIILNTGTHNGDMKDVVLFF
jgi:hypothetical protein